MMITWSLPVPSLSNQKTSIRATSSDLLLQHLYADIRARAAYIVSLDRKICSSYQDREIFGPKHLIFE